jgi:uncharacterized protein (TIGR02466 family)
MTSEIKQVFPVNILHRQVPIKVKDLIREKVHSFIKANPNYADVTYAEVVKTSYKPDRNDFIGDAELASLFSEVMTACQDYMNAQNVFVSASVSVQSWLNIFEPNAVESVHEHFGSFLSGCYYVDTPENCGEIVFKQEATRRAWASEYTHRLRTDFSGIAGDLLHAPKAGELLVFPSWLPHEVMRNRASENRISIAFNLTVAMLSPQQGAPNE